MADDDADQDTDDLDFDERVERAIAKRDEEARRKRERNKAPKDFGDFIDRIADAVWERGEQRAAERRKRDDDADEEPSRGEGEGWQDKVSRFWNAS